ncbi:ECF transporter S component [Fructobacillus sp. M2-14]|uniref:ECF transporter S component n=1 Tax=Fructobacillus broussonetiae TaxID=2713173 RepID=A0ABS5R227_9LACO|nr:ECF transporter S component [Fructobacillus broussonetiae]MBS9338609.1 ECF transporter S component [Fructobacillus broussonetiae]
MTDQSSRRITTIAVLVALNVAISYFIHIPVPATSGFINLVEAGVLFAGLSYGRKSGFIVGALSGALLDLLAGYPQWLLFSFLIHGLEGYIAGIAVKGKTSKKILFAVLSIMIMLLGYTLAGSFLYNWPAGIASIPTNTIQGIAGALVAFFLLKAINQYQK